MKRLPITSGQEVLSTNLEWLQTAKEEAIRERFNDCFSDGILNVLQAGLQPFNMTDNGDGTFSIGPGCSYKTDSTTLQTERVVVLSTDTTSYSATLPVQQTADGIGGYITTPKSTGCKNIPITDGDTKYIGIKYLLYCDSNTVASPTNYSLHPRTGKRVFYSWKDGYEIEIMSSAILVTGTYLGSVSRSGSVITVDMSNRPYVSLRGEVLGLDTSNIVDGAVTTVKLASSAVTGAKIAAAVAGDGLGKDTNGNLKVNVDDSTIEIVSDIVRVKDVGIVEAKIGSGAVTETKIGSSAVTLAKINSELTTGTGTGYGLIPQGGIIMWSGAIANIPSGWALCDGTNSTPNLTDRFVVGAGNTYSVADSGGNNSVNIYHTHPYSGTTGNNSGLAGQGLSAGGFYGYALNFHTHDYSGTTGGWGSTTLDTRPPYYALAFIMKL
jgi:hypothetical protein